MPHWGAALFCLPLVLFGFFWSPRRIVEAYRAGRRSRSLHGSKMIDELLTTPLHVARSKLLSLSCRRWPFDPAFDSDQSFVAPSSSS
jgi:hypothetical protein